jgi:membrane fusion protein, copper/silver efflux system
MNGFHGVILLAVGLTVVGAAVGYRHAHQAPSFADSVSAIQAAAPSSDCKILYYRDPSGAPYWSAEPKKDANGRDYLPVYDDEEPAFGPGGELQKPTRQASGPRKILYYRNPMGLPDVSPTPKKDSMGMEYIAVYEGDDDDGSSIKISPGKIQRIGVKSEPATLRVIAEPIRAPGTIQLDERRIAVIAMRAETFIEKVEDVTTGSEVRKGQPLMRIYSPAIVAAATDYVATLGMRIDSGVRGGRQKLLNLALPESVLSEIERTRQVPQTFTWVAPRDGIVLERNVVEGMRVRSEDVLFRIADHSVVWALVDVPESQLAAVAENQPVVVRVRSYPDRRFPGKVALVYPHLNPSTRTVRVRIELPNPNHVLRPDMYAEAEIDTGSGQPVLSVPDSAVIDSGDRQLVIVDKGEGRFEPRPVKLGRRGTGYVEIREGVTDGEAVVTSANFLIDAESNLKSALKGLTAGAPQ